jgi:carotenoid cleavage dioxygenase-like enzyme
MSSAPLEPAARAWWLRDNFAPVFEERTETRLEVSGAIPPELSGRSSATDPTRRAACQRTGSWATA